MALGKKIPIGLGEKRKLQFRFEGYNTFNRTNYSGVDTTVRFNSKTGVQTSTSLGNFNATRPARIMALSLRFQF